MRLTSGWGEDAARSQWRTTIHYKSHLGDGSVNFSDNINDGLRQRFSFAFSIVTNLGCALIKNVWHPTHSVICIKFLKTHPCLVILHFAVARLKKPNNN